MALGRLERVDLRRAWTSESADFTPWLATEDNLRLLGEVIGVEDLEVEAREQGVGPFKADILCKDTATDSWVLIENQLARTDHTHLGQLLTYAAGLNAVTIVWIAERFTDEHRAALDWLNQITDERINFFGLEIELWRIGDSPPAPKFNVICKPNDWARTLTESARRLETRELTETRQLQREYWAALGRLLRDRKSVVKPQKPLPEYWANFAIGGKQIQLQAFANTRDKRIGVYLLLSGPNAKPYFHLLRRQRAEIESGIGEALEWEEAPQGKESRIRLRRYHTDPADRSDWRDQHEWLRSRLEAFYRAFAPRVKTLNAADYVPEGGAATSTAPE